MGDQIFGGQGVGHLIRAVFTVVGKHIDFIEAQIAVKREPLQQERALIFRACEDQVAQCPAFFTSNRRHWLMRQVCASGRVKSEKSHCVDVAWGLRFSEW